MNCLCFALEGHGIRVLWVFGSAKLVASKNLIEVKEPVVVQGTSCCTTLSFSHFPDENVLFIVGFRNHRGSLTIGVCLDVPKSYCLTQGCVKQGPRVPISQFSLLLLSLRN